MNPVFKRTLDGEAVATFARVLDSHGICATLSADGDSRLEFPLPFKRDGEDDWVIAEGGVILVSNDRLAMQRLIMLARIPDDVLAVVAEVEFLSVLNAINHSVIRLGSLTRDAGDGCVTWRSTSLIPQSGIISNQLGQELLAAMVDDIGSILNAIDEYQLAPKGRGLDMIRRFEP